MSSQKKPHGFDKARRKAEEIIDDPQKVSGLLNNALEKAQHYRGRLRDVWDQLDLLIQMLRSWKNGEYGLPWKSIIMAAAALIYFINPLDIVPDFLFGFGFIDDAAVIGFVINALHEEVSNFREFREEQSSETITGPVSNGKVATDPAGS